MQVSKSRIVLLGILLLIADSLPFISIFAQEDHTVISIAVQSWQRDFIDDEAFDDFEAIHPGVNVAITVIDDDTRYFANPTDYR